MTLRIFISYSQEDFKPEARFICNYLSKHLIDSDVFIDQLKPKGSKWQQENDQKLHESDIVVIILTNGALKSSEVEREASIAQSNPARIIIPCKDDLLKMDWPQVPYSLNSFDGLEFEKKEELGRKLVGEIRSRAYPSISKENTGKSKPVRILGIPNTAFDLNYKITNGDVLSAMIDRDISSLIIALTTYDNGTIHLTLPRVLIDAKVGEQSDVFFVLIDGIEREFTEMQDEEYRKLIIPFKHPVDQIEIIGTEVLGMSYVGSPTKTNVIDILEKAGTPHGGPYLSHEILTIKNGEKVRWHNADTAAHTITSGTPQNGPNGYFDSSLFMSKQDFEVTFVVTGTYHYYCMVHTWITGTIIVT
ncbi:cupredoxin domain containing protein [metagenome]